jgi:hypothetical protein
LLRTTLNGFGVRLEENRLEKAFVFSWTDTRPQDAQAISLLNDVEQPPAVGAVGALRSYAIEPVLWSQRARMRGRLAK